MGLGYVGFRSHLMRKWEVTGSYQSDHKLNIPVCLRYLI